MVFYFMKELKDMTEQDILNEIDSLIENAPEEYREKLLQIQWKCDMIREKYKGNPVGAMVEIQNLMLESAAKLGTALAELKKYDITKH